MDSYLVTGGAGFIGSNIVEYLVDAGKIVRILDNFETGSKENLNFLSTHANKSNVTVIEGDIRDPDTCKNAAKGIRYILHQAALGSVPRSLKYPSLYNDTNVTGTLNILTAAKEAQVDRLVYASSSSVYGDTPTLPKIENMIPKPKSPYAVSKLSTELYAKVYYDNFGLQSIGLRYFNVFGPKQNPNSEYAAVVPKFITQFLSNQSPTIYGDGEQTRDFTYVKNVIQANISACSAETKACGEVYNIGCGERISVNQLAFEIKQLTKASVDVKYEPARKSDVKDSLACIKKAKELLGLPPFIELKEGLKETLSWYIQNRPIERS